MEDQFRRARTILTLGIISLIFMILFITLLVLSLLNTIEISSDEFLYEDFINVFYIMFFGSFIFIGITVILTIVSGVLIFTTDFKNKSIEETQMVMGLLTLICIGPIGAIIFGVKTLGRLRKAKNTVPIHTSVI